MTETKPTLAPDTSKRSAKSAKYRVVKYKDQYYPQEKWLGVWCDMVIPGYVFLTASYDSFEDADDFIRRCVNRKEKERLKNTTEVKAYYSKSGALHA